MSDTDCFSDKCSSYIGDLQLEAIYSRLRYIKNDSLELNEN